MDLSDYEATFWVIILTMTTVGYGDYFPVTVFGRFIGFVASIWGVVVVSLMVVTIANMLELEGGESKSLILLQRL